MTLYEHQSQDTDDGYATKPELWRPLADAVDGFDVDPSSGAESKQIAETVYTKKDDGLAQSWHGSVWLNPPFSENMEWFRKAVNESNNPEVDCIVALAPVDTSTKWFQRWFSQAEFICWLNGRSWYVDEGSPPFNSHIGVFGDSYHDKLRSVLESKGVVTQELTQSDQQSLTDI